MVEPVFVDENLRPADVVTLSGAEAKHAISVRRMRVGEAIAIVDGKGLRIRGEVSAIAKDSLEIRVLEVITEDPPKLSFTLVQALAKGDRDELAIQAATELGLSKVIPWAAERSISRWEGNKRQTGQDRWQQIVLEAAKQSLRSFVPVVEEVSDSAGLLRRLNGYELVLVLDPTAKQSIPNLKLPLAGQIAIIVGPEGGISSEELSLFGQFELVSLGKNILRTSTAGPAVIAALTLGRNEA